MGSVAYTSGRGLFTLHIVVFVTAADVCDATNIWHEYIDKNGAIG